MAQRDLADTIEIRRECTEVPNIVCDTERLQQALYNLIQNAAEAMPRGGVLTLRLGNQNSIVWIDVAGTAPGVAKRFSICFFLQVHPCCRRWIVPC